MSAPPFSSFPAFNSFPALDPGPSKQVSTSEDTHKTETKDRKHDERRSRRDDKGKRRHDDKSRQEKRERRKEEKPRASHEVTPAPTPPASDAATRFFYSDRKGDKLNVKYGGLHAGDIPKYRLVGRGRQILGLNKAFTVVHRDRHGLEVALGKKRKIPALTDSKTRHLLAAAPTRRLTSSQGYKYQEEDGFLRLYSAKASTRDVATYRDPQLAIYVDSEDSESDSANEDETSDEESDGITLDSRQTTLRDLEQRIALDPTSVPTWLNLLSNTLAGVPLHSKNASKARAELSLSVLSRAIAAHPVNEQSSTLRLKLLSAGEELWEETKLAEEWESALQVGGIEMWIMWLDWRLRSSRRGIDGLAEDVQRIYSALPKDDALDKSRVLWRAAVALRDAGYTERAYAVFQAQAELTFKRPHDLASSPFETVLDRLEAFWESEVTRVGEPEAKGWAAWEAAGCPDAEAGPSRSMPPRSASHDPYSRWATDELVLDNSLILPCRSFDEETNSDPYATILFSDIRPFLVDLVSDDAKETLRVMWLSFLGLHIPGSSPVADDRWSSSHLAAPSLMATLFPQELGTKLITADAHSGVLIGKERTLDHPFGPIKNWGTGVVDVTEGVIAGRFRMWSRIDVADVPAALTREVFQQCKQSAPDADWDMLLVAFEGALNPKQATKLCKQLLSSAQDSILHWKAYAQLERLRGKPDDARKVYNTVLASSSDKPGVAQLWWDWVELEWISGTSEAALQVILSSAGTKGSGTVAFLRGRRALDDAARGVFALWKDREAYVKLRALLELLTTGTASALSVFDQTCSSLPIGSAEHESLTVAALNMLYGQGRILSNAFKPGVLRERVERAIQIYPDNTLILGFFLAAEKGEGVWGRVRAMLSEDDTAKDLTRIMADVWAASWERGSWRLEEERIRTKLSNAALNERTRYSAILWRIYLHFELRCGRLKQAKTLLFRAVKECPLAKDLYLLAFGPLRTVFSPRELNDWAETMGERGIRMRQGLDELLEGWTETMGSRMKLDGESDGEDDEIEHNASELRRLRPY